MPPDLYLAFVLACVVLIVIPGPNVARIVANSVPHGGRFGLLTVAGTSPAASWSVTNPKTLLFYGPFCRSSSRLARPRPISCCCCWP